MEERMERGKEEQIYKINFLANKVQQLNYHQIESSTMWLCVCVYVWLMKYDWLCHIPTIFYGLINECSIWSFDFDCFYFCSTFLLMRYTIISANRNRGKIFQFSNIAEAAQAYHTWLSPFTCWKEKPYVHANYWKDSSTNNKPKTKQRQRSSARHKRTQTSKCCSM